MLGVEDDENIVFKEKGTHSSHDDHEEKKDNPSFILVHNFSSSPPDKKFFSKAPFPQRLISP